MLNMSLRILPAMNCSICNTLILEENNIDIEKALFGANKYAVCPLCGGEVNKKDRTKAYKKRVDKYLEKGSC